MPIPLDFLVAVSPLVALFVLWVLEDLAAPAPGRRPYRRAAAAVA
jgi:hypothetical protein